MGERPSHDALWLPGQGSRGRHARPIAARLKSKLTRGSKSPAPSTTKSGTSKSFRLKTRAPRPLTSNPIRYAWPPAGNPLIARKFSIDGRGDERAVTPDGRTRSIRPMQPRPAHLEASQHQGTGWVVYAGAVRGDANRQADLRPRLK